MSLSEFKHMDKEYTVLTELCREYLSQKSFKMPTDIDFLKLFKLSKAHNLTAVCHCAVKNAENKKELPPDFLKALEEGFFDAVYLYELQSNSYNEIKELFSENDIKFIPFKGIKMRSLFPVPESRVMGDTDILIQPSERDKVKKLLLSHGFECTRQNGPVYNYEKDGCLTEIHTRLIEEYPTVYFENPFDYAVFDGYEGELDDSFHTAYLIAHTAHHFKFYGAGIKLLLDLAVIQSKKDIDLEKVFEYLDAAGLKKFGEVILSVCFKWFSVGKLYTDDTEKTEEYLMRCGAFGNENDNKGAVITRKELEEHGASSDFKLKLHLLFPPYSKLKNIDYIKFIDGRPWLTPYAWCYRIIYNISKRKKFMTRAVRSLDDENTKKAALDELRFFREIGL